MVRFFHSPFARDNTKNQINGWIKEIEKSLESRRKELRKFRILAPLTPSNWDNLMIPILEEELKAHKLRLMEYMRLRDEYENDGLI